MNRGPLMGWAGDIVERVRDGFASLRGTPPELPKAYVLKFLDSYAYFSFSLIFTLFLSSDFGFSDVEAGTAYGAWGALVTVFGLLTGFVIDSWGVAASLRVGFAVSLAARIMIFLTTSRAVLYANVFVLLPLGNCLGIPVLATGVRRYTREDARGFAFGLFYVIMNVAALLSGPVVDACTILYRGNGGEGGEGDGNGGAGWTLSGYRAVLLTGIVANVVGCGITWTMREIKVEATTWVGDADGEGAAGGDADAGAGAGVEGEGVSEFVPRPVGAWESVRETLRTPSFWKFLAVCLLTLNVRMIFRHLDATLPKYMLREFGPDTAKGTVYAINPAMIIVLVPLITAGTREVDPLLMIHHGAYVSAASVFFLVLSTSVWACVAFVVVLSIGEAIWSPRLYDYTMKMCSEGREGTYMALSSAPLFLAQLPVGAMSGFLLERYCPEEGPRNSKMMWLIIGLTTAVSPLLLTATWRYIASEPGEEAVSPGQRGRGDADEGIPVLRGAKMGSASSSQYRKLDAGAFDSAFALGSDDDD